MTSYDAVEPDSDDEKKKKPEKPKRKPLVKALRKYDVMPIIDAMCLKMLFRGLEPVDQVQVLAEFVEADTHSVSLPEVRAILME